MPSQRRPSARVPIGLAALLRHHLVRRPAASAGGVRLGGGLVQLGVGAPAGRADQPQPRRGGAALAQGRQHADLGRPLAQQGHDRPRLLQPRHPGLRQRLQEARREGLLLQGRRREHRLEHVSRRRRHGRRSTRCSWTRPATAPTSWAALGRDRGRGVQGRRRQEDVDRPLRRQVRRPTAEGDPQADRRSRRRSPSRERRPSRHRNRRPSPRPSRRPRPPRPDAATPAPADAADQRSAAQPAEEPAAVAGRAVRQPRIPGCASPRAARAAADCSRRSSAAWPASSSAPDAPSAGH